MDSKKEKRLYFDWQKSFSEYLFIISLLIGVFAIRNEFPKEYRLIVYLFLSILIFLTGASLIKTNFAEKEYLDLIKDNRYKKSIWKRTWEAILLILTVIMAFAIVYVALEIWKKFLIGGV